MYFGGILQIPKIKMYIAKQLFGVYRMNLLIRLDRIWFSKGIFLFFSLQHLVLENKRTKKTTRISTCSPERYTSYPIKTWEKMENQIKEYFVPHEQIGKGRKLQQTSRPLSIKTSSPIFNSSTQQRQNTLKASKA